MAWMFAFKTTLLPDPDKEGQTVEIAKRTVFNTTPELAKQLIGLSAARPATGDEIKAAKTLADKANGLLPAEPVSEPAVDDSPKPASGAPGDPQTVNKAKSL